MPNDLTVLRLDVDSEAIRLLLEALPGVSPADLPDRTSDERTERDSETPPATERTGPRVGETPPPGAGDQRPDEVETESDGGRRWLLLGGVGAALLTAIAGVAAVIYRRRSGGVDDLSLPDVSDTVPVPDVSDHVGFLGDDEGDEAGTDDVLTATDGAGTDRQESTVDAAPLLGMALLAVGAVVVRAVQSDDTPE